MTYQPPNHPGYPAPQQTAGYGVPAAPPPVVAAPGPSKLPAYLTVSVAVLGLLAYLFSFGPLFNINTNLGPFGGAELTASGMGYWTISALIAALLAIVGLIAKDTTYSPVVTVAATFQKDPTVLISHPGTGVTKIEDLKGRPIAIGAASDNTFWPWLKARYGFADAQKRPYAFSVQPFLADKLLSQQGYVTSEPYSAEKGGVKPVVLLLADQAYPPYAETVVVTRDTLARRGDAVKRFIQASAEGWKSYLANPAPGNALIKKDNPQMEDDLLAHGVRTMRQYAMVTGGDAVKQGIMTMTDARWKQTFDFMVKAGMVDAKVDYRKAYSLDLVKDVKVLP